MSGPAPAVAAVRSAVRADLADLTGRADPGGVLVLVACSGGPDSLALAAAAGFVAPRLGLRAGAVVVDHGWHDGSAQVAARAADAARGLGLTPVLVLRVPDAAGRDGGDREGRARAARYALLEDAAARTGAAAVLLGHTRDDQAEQVLLGLARGSGARSLAGMPARRGLHRRPLLALARTTTEAACAALGLEPWHDPANADPAFTRVRVRTALLPALERDLGPGVAAALARTADQLREDADALDALAQQLRTAARRAPGPGQAPGGLDVAVLAAAPPALRTRALRREAIAAGCPAGALTRAHVLAVDSLVTAWRGQGPLPLPGGAAARRACGRLTILTAPETGAGTGPTGRTGATTTGHATTD